MGNDFTSLAAPAIIGILHEQGFLDVVEKNKKSIVYRVSGDIEIASSEDDGSLWIEFEAITSGFWDFFELKEPLGISVENRSDWEADLFTTASVFGFLLIVARYLFKKH